MGINSNIKVLVVGGAGYIGGSVVDELLAKQIPFTVYDALFYEERYLKPVDFIYGDVRDTGKLIKILPSYTHVIWLVAIVGDGACALHPEAAVEINELAVKWLSENYNGRIIFTSTCSVYGSQDREVTEEDKPTPLSLYATTKANAEKYIVNKNAVILRLGTAFGLSDQFSRPRFDLLVNTLASNAVLRGEIMVFGGSQWRPNIHVKDIAEVIVRCLDERYQGIYNVATENYTIDEIAKIIAEIASCRIRYANRLQEDRRDYRVSFDKAVKAGLIRIPTQRNIRYGAKEIIDLVKSGRIKEEGISRYSNEKHLASKFI